MMVVFLAFVGAVLILYFGSGALLGKKKRNQALFKLGYRLYDTPLGAVLHRMVIMRQKKNGPHSRFDAESRSVLLNNGNTLVVPLPILSNNYSYLIVDLQSKTGALIDPADPAAVALRLSSLSSSSSSSSSASRLSSLLAARGDQSGARLVITDVFCTHWHLDHSAGSSTLLHWARTGKHSWPTSLAEHRIAISPDLRVFGPRVHSSAGITHALEHEQVVHLGPATGITALHTPGHTRFHLCFAVGSAALFTGDLLFASGVGKFFEGTAVEVQHSICSVLAPRLEPQTLLFPGHEYAKTNLAFAASLSNPDPAVDKELARVTELRKNRTAAIPVTWASQMTLNPFVQVLFSSEFQRHLRQLWQLDEQTPPVELLARLRLEKNRF